MTPTNETGLVHAIVKAIIKRYPTAWVFKVHGNPYQTAGVPDLLVCVEGRLIGLEAKFQRPTESEDHALGRATPRQRAQIIKINEAGGVAAVVLSPASALRVIEAALSRSQGEQE